LKILAVIPARGGSKGIPRKSIRPVAGKPMIYYSIKACLESNVIDRVVVSTDDEEIALLAKRFGATVLMRDPELANDITTLDPVILAAVNQAECHFNENFEHVFTIQPTSPLIQSHDLDLAASLFHDNPGTDSVITVVDDRHLCWTLESGEAKPVYSERVNRQQLPENFRETGAIIACTREQLEKGSRIGTSVSLLEMPAIRSFDIDNFSDLYLCEGILSRKKIVFVVVGYPEVGLGHAFRAVMLAHELVNFDLHFICDKKSTLAAEYIKGFNYQVEICEEGDIISSIASLSPHLVINDILDTQRDFVLAQKSLGCKVVNFEDLGAGSESADLVINALYPHQINQNPNILVGAAYFCLRDEFLYLPTQMKNEKCEKILITFGGVDEGNLTCRVLELLAPIVSGKGIEVDIILGPGYQYKKALEQLVLSLKRKFQMNIIVSTKRISDYMFSSDIAITSAGRTVLELASIPVPTIAICQNIRETTHTFASDQNGVLNLGYRIDVTDDQITSAIKSLLGSATQREKAVNKMKSLDLSKGKARVISRITELLG
jgi:CMP-N-acetylneuraminic acid synthetase/spore coat polysaccharide biosynthesis predicted glycosyltransferase SpsG